MYIYYGFIVDQGWSSIYGFIEPQTIQPSGNSHDPHQTLFANMDGWVK